MVVHARVDDGAAARVREAVAALDPLLPLPAVRPIEVDMSFALLGARVGAGLLSAFAVLALLVASIGVHGVTAYTVSRRTAEIGIRAALGATRREVLRLLLVDTLRLVALGLALGLAGGVGLAKLAASQLYGVGLLDAPTLLLVPTFVLAAAAVAALLPVVRASSLDPARTLRAE
jgi:ABC-type antimicrobial peptide transport system permease subunit